MPALFRLVRLPNLIIIALTMLAVRYGLIETLWRKAISDFLESGFLPQGFGLHMSTVHFTLLLISTLCIAAAGYIINDYFDTKTDRINKPERVVVGRSISRRMAIGLHIVLSSLGFLLAAWVCYRLFALKLLLFQILSIGALWIYSAYLKKQMLSGNILIALLAALVPVMTGVYEFAAGSLLSLEIMNVTLDESGSKLLKTGAILVIGYALFAFLSNLIRELVKDLEDLEGDLEDGCRTLPVVVGETQARFLAMGIAVFTLMMLALIMKYLWQFELNGLVIYLAIGVQVPLLMLIHRLWNAREKSDYTKASLLAKICIVTGVLSMVVFRFLY
jgi:4-hydroxybenzoate polyprenyltransferase